MVSTAGCHGEGGGSQTASHGFAQEKSQTVFCCQSYLMHHEFSCCRRLKLLKLCKKQSFRWRNSLNVFNRCDSHSNSCVSKLYSVEYSTCSLFIQLQAALDSKTSAMEQESFRCRRAEVQYNNISCILYVLPCCWLPRKRILV